MIPSPRQPLFFMVLAALLFLGTPLPGSAAFSSVPAQIAGPCSVVPAVMPAAGWLDKIYSALVSALRDNQKRMVQFCLVGMLVALWIIWWRK